jgi:hypothetical protein
VLDNSLFLCYNMGRKEGYQMKYLETIVTINPDQVSTELKEFCRNTIDNMHMDSMACAVTCHAKATELFNELIMEVSLTIRFNGRPIYVTTERTVSFMRSLLPTEESMMNSVETEVTNMKLDILQNVIYEMSGVLKNKLK